jgi:hypothetical protein
MMQQQHSPDSNVYGAQQSHQQHQAQQQLPPSVSPPIGNSFFKKEKFVGDDKGRDPNRNDTSGLFGIGRSFGVHAAFTGESGM